MARIKLRYVNGFANRDRKSQRARYYFRRHGTKAIPLPGLPGSEEFMAAYAAALASIPEQHVEIAANRTLPGTINALVVNYYKSDEWHSLAADCGVDLAAIAYRDLAGEGPLPPARMPRDARKRWAITLKANRRPVPQRPPYVDPLLAPDDPRLALAHLSRFVRLQRLRPRGR